jgi:hypothetical protein
VNVSEAKPAAWVFNYTPVARCVGDVEGLQTKFAVLKGDGEVGLGLSDYIGFICEGW